MLRAITELWQQLRIIPVIAAPRHAAKWQLLRHRFQKAIAEGASTSQVTAISVLASIYLQAVIAASMEEVEIFLSPLTARSKIREVLRGLVATRQVHTLTLGHAPHYYVAGTLPEFAPPPTVYASSAVLAGGYFSRFSDHEESLAETPATEPVVPAQAGNNLAGSTHFAAGSATTPGFELHANGGSNGHKPAANAKAASARTHFSRTAAHARNRKPAQPAGSARQPRRTSEGRPGTARSAASNGHSANGSRSAKSPVSGWNKRSATGKAASSGRTGTLSRSAARKDSRTDARSARAGRTAALTAGAKAGNGKRYGFTARRKQGTSKRG